MPQTYPFSMMPLPYAYDALEPYISQNVIEIHYTRHLKSYVDNLNSILQNYPEFYGWTLENLLYNLEYLPPSIQNGVQNNGGGVYNHQLYFQSMTIPAYSKPSNAMVSLIKENFGSQKWFQNAFMTTALKVFGSGYTWLVITQSHNLAIIMTKDQNCPISSGLIPLLCIDVWEHAYYLQYLNMRNDYIVSWFNLINWNNVEYLYHKAIK